MHPFKKMIYMLRTEITPETPEYSYCVNWIAANDGNIKMSTSGYIDFTAMLAGRTIAFLYGEITGYVIVGMSPFSCSIPMTFTDSKAEWDTNTLPVETDKVLTSLIYTVNVIFNDASEFDIIGEQTNAVVILDQTTSSYNSCV